jgi:hypothetical protein
MMEDEHEDDVLGDEEEPAEEDLGEDEEEYF